LAAAPPEGQFEVTVTAPPRHPLAPAGNPDVSGSVIVGRRLEEPGTALGSVLRAEPGLQTSELGGLGAPSTVSLRGALALETPVYLAGIRLNDEHNGAFDLSQVPLWFVERVQVYRSYVPLDRVESGMAGAIYIEPRVPRKSEARLGILGGSYGARGGWMLAAAAQDQTGVIAGVRGLWADNRYPYLDDRGTLFDTSDDRESRQANGDVSSKDAWLTLRRPLGPLRLRALAHAYGREQGAPRLALIPSRRARERRSRQLVSLQTELEVRPGFSIETNSYLGSTGEELSDPLRELALGSLGVQTNETRIGSTLAVGQHTPTYHARAVIGWAETRLARAEADAPSLFWEPALVAFRIVPRLGASFGWSPLPWLRASAEGALGLQLTRADPSENGQTEAYDVPWRVGAAADCGRITLYTNYGTGYRVPSLAELFGASALVRGNPALSAERGTTVEVGARWTAPRRSRVSPPWLDAAAFVRRSRDLVTYLRSSQGYVIPVNLHSALVRGAELAAGIGLYPGVTVTSSLSVLDPRDRSPDRLGDNDLLPYVSRLTAALLMRVELPWKDEQLGPCILGGQLVYSSSRFADRAGLEVMPAQTVAQGSVRMDALAGLVSASLRVDNLLNTRRFDVIGFPLPGRVFILASEVKW
jgi:iron complex outermembrane receptor protein